MLRNKVNSSNLKYISHNARRSILTVTFCNGSKYRYQNVPADLARHLWLADVTEGVSVGRTFNALIRRFPERYPYERLA